MQLLWDHRADILGAFLTTIQIMVLASVIAAVVGVIMAVCRVSPVAPLRILGTGYVEVIRNTPLLVLLIFLVFALPDAGITIPLFACMFVGVGVYAGTQVCEVVRSGISAVPSGQIEAARALGFGFFAIIRFVVLPVALRLVIQPLTNVAINTALSTSMAAALGVVELTALGPRLQEGSAEILLTFGVIVVGYVLITSSLSAISHVIERKLGVQRG